jgi:hypothetical protein
MVEDWGAGYWDSWPDGVHYRYRRLDAGRIRERIGYHVASRIRRKPDGIFTNVLSVLKRYLIGSNSSSHNAGMVGFVKELIDECALADIHHPEYGLPSKRNSTIKEITFRASHARILKK